MNKFKVGDRVAVYEYRRVKGKVIHVYNYDNTVLIETNKSVMFVHKKQCRKLVKKVNNE